MAVYIVAYDLNNEIARPNITKEIKKRPWARLSESSYAVDTEETTQDVYDSLRPMLDNDDNLYVITLKRPYSGWGPKPVNDWLDERLR